MFTGQPRHVRSFLWFLAGSALVLLIFVILTAGREPEWVPAADYVDDGLIPVNDPSPPHFTPGTLSLRTDESMAPVPMAAAYSTRWRAGVGVPDLDLAYFDWPTARPGWYLNWSTNVRTEPIFLGLGSRSVMDAPPDRFGMEFTPMVRMKNGRLFPDTHTLRDLARRYRGLTWLIGNEPDVRWQDNTPPEIYAVAFQRAYSAIKAGDPTAQIAIGGVSQITPLRLEYLTRVWDFYRTLYGTAIPVDVWTMHAFVLREERSGWGVNMPPGFYIEQRGELWEVGDHDSLALVEQQIRAMRQWMTSRGLQDKPLWITEYGILMPEEYGFPPERVSRFLVGSFDLFQTLRDETLGMPGDGHRLVQRWNWYSARDSRYPTGNLFDNWGESTPVGDTYWEYLRTTP